MDGVLKILLDAGTAGALILMVLLFLKYSRAQAGDYKESFAQIGQAHREDLAVARREFIDELKRSRAEFLAAIDRIESRHAEAVGRLPCPRKES